MRDIVRVDLAERSYDIVIGPGVIAGAGARISALAGRRPVVVVTDDTVAPLHLPALEASLDEAGVRRNGPAIVLPAGEKTKSFVHLEALLDDLLGRGIERSTMLVALGGGVIGDLAGFAAAVALRGLDFVQVPTTLLAQVDSSVGGKTGINTRQGKNLVGSFHQPRLVLADTGALATLSRRHMLAGYAEVVKYGLIDDAGFFAWLEEHGAAVCAGEPEALVRAVTVSCAAKAAIVGQDERESGRRALLNFGHTFGHALEAAVGYDDRLLHGEGVALGMGLAFDLSARLGYCDAEVPARVRRHLDRIGLPTRLGQVAGVTWDTQELLGHMAKDKKVQDGRITFVLARGIGQAFTARDIDGREVAAVLDQAR
ncbi:3-dehydroquinate synthase [Skermanella mucosa]|uniref:3-dehydroquinate synthase n=1 Tax=Skermanella mucosa TaxID=1789672 RepID=UPI001E5F6D67|nr:3-dehydroquinate synthase [Skermanella mucosa]UEM21545.1 3-dehydroquinate synthase [Skermanella mucosa]